MHLSPGPGGLQVAAARRGGRGRSAAAGGRRGRRRAWLPESKISPDMKIYMKFDILFSWKYCFAPATLPMKACAMIHQFVLAGRPGLEYNINGYYSK